MKLLFISFSKISYRVYRLFLQLISTFKFINSAHSFWLSDIVPIQKHLDASLIHYALLFLS